ncbi:hypothetical protein TNCV_3314551 [Trichonephila clavipes]|nr:hypothetical protein TNCV_3314551 [Trichonephila clavipes]
MLKKTKRAVLKHRRSLRFINTINCILHPIHRASPKQRPNSAQPNSSFGDTKDAQRTSADLSNGRLWRAPGVRINWTSDFPGINFDPPGLQIFCPKGQELA